MEDGVFAPILIASILYKLNKTVPIQFRAQQRREIRAISRRCCIRLRFVALSRTLALLVQSCILGRLRPMVKVDFGIFK